MRRLETVEIVRACVVFERPLRCSRKTKPTIQSNLLLCRHVNLLARVSVHRNPNNLAVQT